MSQLRVALTYANVMATIAVFLALGGGAYAATRLPDNSVGTKQIMKEAVTPAKLNAAAKRLLSGPTGATGAAGEAGAKGTQGLQGDPGGQGGPGAVGQAGAAGQPGEQGEQGDPGISNGYFFTSGPAFDEWDGGEQLLATLTLPAGNYIIDSHVLGNNNAGETASYSCMVRLGGIIIGETGEASLGANTDGEDRSVISLSLAGNLATAGTAEFICRAQAGFPGNWLERGMTAIQVTNLIG
jgi:collagen triple helix repeat protein